MIYICKSEPVCCFLIFRWNPGEGCEVRKFTLRRWYRIGLKDANLSGWKSVCRRSGSWEYPPENIHTSFLPDIHHDKACKTDVGTSGNRSRQIEESFGIEREIVWRRMYGRFCMLLGLHLSMQISFHLVFLSFIFYVKKSQWTKQKLNIVGFRYWYRKNRNFFHILQVSGRICFILCWLCEVEVRSWFLILT